MRAYKQSELVVVNILIKSGNYFYEKIIFSDLELLAEVLRNFDLLFTWLLRLDLKYVEENKSIP